ncbi:MAG: Competence protein ComEC [Candidatus Curtissbacteria bacterium GW2011_GWA1_40_16]|uniref:Competence protein ComEC n=1 Tax=Candidatus Curtissbacteria bacterium GW2011_GWA1_40_16 TaxID=1618405 RepID=A0A0G0RLI1_9BACT|nr:MAG: Competence protein ComEC [Candidatus Curtissbacteria bacterium GW2011_GWA1_40_16]
MDNKSKAILTISLCLFVLGILAIAASGKLGRVRIIACDVGQGDGILIITPGGRDVVIDGGPGSKIADCLSRYMPFWDRTVEMMVLSHPQQDHMEGQMAVFANYKVEHMVTTGVKNDTELHREWQKALVAEGSKVYKPVAGDSISVDGVNFEVLWPASVRYNIWEVAPPTDVNESSVILRLSYSGQCAYFTGDIPKEILEMVADRNCSILKVAHHGSKTGTSPRVLEEIKPAVAIISVGKNNRFGHPHKEVVDMLEAAHSKILRNDQLGNVEVDLDSKGKIIYKQ